MKELLDGFSVERLEYYANNEPPFGYTGSDIQNMARIALAVKQAEPLVLELNEGVTDEVKAAFVQGMKRYSGAMLTIAAPAPQPVAVPDLSSLKRYDLDMSDCDSCGQDCGADMSEDPDGDYVLFADVVAILSATQTPEAGA